MRNIRIDGKVPPAQRQGLVETFQARARARARRDGAGRFAARARHGAGLAQAAARLLHGRGLRVCEMRAAQEQGRCLFIPCAGPLFIPNEPGRFLVGAMAHLAHALRASPCVMSQAFRSSLQQWRCLRQGDPSVLAAVLSITAAGTGLTLTARANPACEALDRSRLSRVREDIQ